MTTSTVDRSLWRVAFILVMGTFMASLDGTIVSVGLETLTQDFHASVTDVQWATTAYLLAVVAAVPAAGWLADRFGGRRVWITAVAVFLVGSLLCALAWSLPSLIIFRVIQGLGGGLLPPTGQALLARIAGRERIGKLISVVGVVPLLTPVLGPVAGGVILGIADWPWLFLINLPIGAVVLVLATRYVPVIPPAAEPGAFDLRGALLLSPGLAVLVYGLTSGNWATAVPVGALALLVFVIHGLRTERVPLLDPRLFTQPPFGPAALALTVLSASVFGTMFLLPLFLQRDLIALETGLLLAPQGLGAALGSTYVTRRVDKLAPRTLVLAGILFVALGTVPFTQLAGGLHPAITALALFVRGVGASCISAPVMAMIYRTIEPPKIPRAASALAMLGTVGGSVGTAVLAVVLQARLAARGTDVAAAYGDTFWWVLAMVVIAALAATRLPTAHRS
ncbi:DHA2 family efflux MFS transporter permease subunit [Pseudonocardiaceae bacterium YIM PH 21723]|nr:DHA2 family efflux MFS transporter permease subunit [Pseudonocardiaceae bacterium YIM PH 21723]